MHRRWLPLLMLAFAALVWLGADAARVVHESTVVHVACVHGQVTELPSASADDEGEVAKAEKQDAPSKDFHTHGCTFDALGSVRASPPTALPARTATVAPAATVYVLLGEAARPPPLTFAPKTSPPAHG